MGIRLMLILTIPILLIPLAYAQPDHIGIQLSGTCRAMIINDIPGCPTYEEILTLHPDTTDKRVSGHFDYSDNGFYERQKHEFGKNLWKYYIWDEGTMIWVDPPGSMKDRVRLIVIEPSLPEYKTKQTTIDNKTLAIGFDRWHNPNCSKTVMSAKDWVFLLGDTINFVKHNCNPEFTNFDPIKYLKWEEREFDRTTTYKYKLDKFIAEAKERCKGLCWEY